MKPEDVRAWILQLLADGDSNLHGFYASGIWESLRREVLKEDKGECQSCKARGRYTPANHVHHVNFIKYRSELALSKVFTDAAGIIRRNLISVCKPCHEEIHDYRQKHRAPPLTEERW